MTIAIAAFVVFVVLLTISAFWALGVDEEGE